MKEMFTEAAVLHTLLMILKVLFSKKEKSRWSGYSANVLNLSSVNMETYVLLHFEHKNVVTIIANKNVVTIISEELRVEFDNDCDIIFCSNVTGHRYSWNKCFKCRKKKMMQQYFTGT